MDDLAKSLALQSLCERVKDLANLLETDGRQGSAADLWVAIKLLQKVAEQCYRAAADA